MLMMIMGYNTANATYRMEIGLEASNGGSLSNGSINFSGNGGGSSTTPLGEGCYGELNKNYVHYIYTNEYIDYILFENGSKLMETRRYHEQDYEDYMDINSYRYILVGDALFFEEKEDGVHVYVAFCKTKL